MLSTSLKKTLLILYLTIPLFIFATHISYSQNDWKLKKQKNGIKVYTKSHASENLKYYKLTTTFRADFSKVVQLNLDFDNYETWVKDCAESKIIDKMDENTIIYYSRIDTPWPVNDRDFLSEVNITLGQNQILIHTKPASIDYPESKGAVRMIEYEDHWRIKNLDSGMVKLELEGFYNPGGSIPSWIVNMFIVDAPYESVLKLKELTGTEY